MDKTSLACRMKEYEFVQKNHLMRRTPAVIRLDGKAFHTFTCGFDKPFDAIIETAMKETMLYLCKNIQGCVLGYTQSDEISLILCDYQKTDTCAWFDYNVQKMVSVAASMTTFKFLSILAECRDAFPYESKSDLLYGKIESGAFFDARCFSLPKNEVTNYLIWRQHDASRNSIQALAQSIFQHKDIQGLTCNMLQDKMFTERGVNWNDLSVYQKRGTCGIKEPITSESEVARLGWVMDDCIPVFKENRNYVESRINFDSDDI